MKDRYSKELTNYARRVLRDLYGFAAQHGDEDLKMKLAELLAFASNNQINQIALKLNYEKDPASFIAKSHGAWLESPNNPAFLRPQKQRKMTIKTPSKIATIRKNFK